MMKRRTMSAAISIAAVPNLAIAPDIQTQALEAIEARPKLQAAIDEQKQKLKEAKRGLARSFATQTQAAARIDVERAFQSHKAEQELEEQTQQRIEALESIQTKINDHLDQLKTESPEAVHAALMLRVGTLEKEASEKKTAGDGFAEELRKLRIEINKLPKSAGKKANEDY
jgi:hypothetical protein